MNGDFEAIGRANGTWEPEEENFEDFEGYGIWNIFGTFQKK